MGVHLRMAFACMRGQAKKGCFRQQFLENGNVPLHSLTI